MKILRISLLISLALTASAWAQGAAPLSKAERIALCEKKIDVPFDPADPPPLHVGLHGKKGEPTRPVLLRNVRPGGFASHPSGTLILEVVIDEDGCVRQPKVLKGEDAGMVDVGLKTIRKWVFAPATLDGKPVRVSYVLTINSM
jgi:Gram-negative bacterial TonB protein C-terminal